MKKHILVVTLICFSFMLHGQISITMNDAVSTALRFANREYLDTEPVYFLAETHCFTIQTPIHLKINFQPMSQHDPKMCF